MGYTTTILDVQRERNLGASVDEDGTLTITGPTSIEGSSVTVTWSLGGTLADAFRVTLGSTIEDSQIADSGEIASTGGTEHTLTFTGLTYPTTTAYLTVYYRFGDGPFYGIRRTLPVNLIPIDVDPDPAKNWDDSEFWDDTEFWDE